MSSARFAKNYAIEIGLLLSANIERRITDTGDRKRICVKRL